MVRRSGRDTVLREWRRLDIPRIGLIPGKNIQSLNEVMPRVLKELRIDRRQGETEILKVWNHLMDPNVVAHAHPTGLHKGTLFVTVDSSVWLDEIVRYRRREILERLQHSFGRDLIARISFRAG